MLSAICGGVVPNTVWLGHAGLKKPKRVLDMHWCQVWYWERQESRSVYVLKQHGSAGSMCSDIFMVCDRHGLHRLLKDCDKKHYAAVGIAMVPPVADYLYTQITGSVGLAGYMTEVMPSGLAEYNAEVTQMIKDAGVMWNGVPAVKSGAIIIGILLGTMTVFIIDKQLHKVAITAVVGYVLACFGFIHSAGLGFNPASPFAIGYLIVAVLAIILHQGRKSWFEGRMILIMYDNLIVE